MAQHIGVGLDNFIKENTLIYMLFSMGIIGSPLAQALKKILFLASRLLTSLAISFFGDEKGSKFLNLIFNG